MVVKPIIQSSGDLVPDITANTLTVRLHGLSTPRHNKAAAEPAKILTDTETVLPAQISGLSLKLLQQHATRGKEV
ncbi:MAG: hypothetical protein ACREHG_01285 [Candidatus Saccharimonadales bacterium]